MAALRTLQKRVKRGVELLDEKCPGWVEKISLYDLDLENQFRCVLGQLHGDYFTGVDRLLGVEADVFAPAAIRHGFQVEPSMVVDGGQQTCSDDYTELQQVWERRIKKLKKVS